MSLLTKNSIIEIGIQADRNTPVANPTPIKVFDINFEPFHAVRTIERMNATGVFGNDASMFGGHLNAVTFSWEITPSPSGSQTSPPSHDALYRIASFSRATVGNNNQYTPVSNPDDMPYAHINFYFGLGRLRTMYSAVCSALTLTFNAGEKAMATATFVGYFISETDTIPAAKTFSAVKPFVCKGVTVALGGITSLPVKSLVLEMGLATPNRGDMTHSSSYAPPIITNRIVSGTIVMEQSKLAINNWAEDIRNGAEMNLAMGLAAPDLTITCPNVVLTNSNDGDDEGVRTDELQFMAARSGQGGEILINIGKAV